MWRVAVEEGCSKVVFAGAPGLVTAQPFRGRVHREMALGLRSLEIPSCRNQLRPGWEVEMPPWVEQRNNARDRNLMVFRCPNVGETVLEFIPRCPPELEAAIFEAFGATTQRKENGNGDREVGRSSEADGRPVPLAPDGLAAGEGERGGRGEGPRESDQPEGQREGLSDKTPPTLTRKLLRRLKRKRGRR